MATTKKGYAKEYDAAVALLDELGAGTEMTLWVEYVPMRLHALQAQAKQVDAGIRAGTGFAYFNFNEDVIADWGDARAAVADYLIHWDKLDNFSKTPPMAGIVAVDQTTLAAAAVLNRMKVAWEELHKAIRVVAGRHHGGEFSTRLASEAMRNLLRLINESRLNLDATDRKIPIIDGSPLAIRWFKANARPTARRTVADLVTELRRVRLETAYLMPEVEQLLDAEIVKFGSMNQSTPIAFRVRSGNESQRFRATYIDGKVRRRTQGYAGNPILCLESNPVLTPTMNVYEEGGITKAGAKKNLEAMGPRVRVTDKPVVSVRLGELPFYSWYSEKRAPEKKAPVKTKKNPYSSTAFPGLWLGPRKTKDSLNPTVIVQLLDRSQCRFSIARHGIERAWELAAMEYSKDRGIALAPILALRPSMQAVNDMLAWAEMAELGEGG